MTKTAVIYIRVSTAEQADTGTSLATQETACRAWCSAHELTVMRLFSDAGESAKTADRPQFLELLSWCSKNKPTVCVVWKFDRWARSATDHAIASGALSKHGTRLVSATEAAADDPAGRLLQTILSGIAQFDNEVRAERAKHAMRSVAMRGGWFTHAPYGYRFSRSGSLPVLVEDTEQATVVRDLFQRLADRTRSLWETVAEAKRHGLTETQVRKMLRKPVYAGIIRSRLTNDRDVQAAFPGLISRDTWMNAQAAMDGKKQGPHRQQRTEFPLRGLLVCQVCRRPVTACFVTGHGGRYGYYQCKQGHVRARDERVHSSWMSLLSESSSRLSPIVDQIRDRIRNIIDERVSAIRAVEQSARHTVDVLRRRRARLLDAFLIGAIPKAEFESRDHQFDEKIRSAEQASRRTVDWGMDVESAVSKCASLLDDPVALWGRLNVEQRQRFARGLFGDEICLMPAGTVQTVVTGGIAGALIACSDDSGQVARPRGEWSNHLGSIVRGMAALSDLAA